MEYVVKRVVEMALVKENERIMVERELEKIDDIKYSIIIPKYDNSGRKIKPEVIEKKVRKMARHFGGVTVIPSVLGCWEDEDGKLVCEENAEIYSIRNFEGDEDKTKIRLKDLDFVFDLAKEIGEELGQASVMISNAKTEMAFVSGKYRENLKEKTGIDWFKKLL